MKKHLISAAILLLLSLGAFAEGIVFQTGTWAQILDKSKTENKLIFLDAYTSWCGPCKWMAKTAFPDPEVAAFFNANFINATMDMEKGEGVELAQRYAVSAYPTLLFIDGSGAMVHVAIGARGAQDLLQLGKDVVEGRTTGLPKMIKRFEAGERDRVFLRDYILALAEIGMSVDAPLAHFKPTMEGEGLLDADSWKVFQVVFQKHDSPFAVYFKEHIGDFRARYGRAADQKACSFFNNAWSQAINDKDKAAYDATCAEIRSLGVPNIDSVLAGADMYFYQYTEDYKAFAKAAKRFVPMMREDAMSLNDVSWAFFEHVDKKADLNVALGWAERSVALDPGYANTDTQAMLLKKLGRTQEAIATAERAIALAKESGEDYAETQKALDQMKAGK